MKHRRNEAGFGLIEVAIGVAIMGLVLVSAVLALTAYIRVGLGNTAKIQAAYHAEGGLEVARGLRDADWSTFAALATATPFYLSFNGVSWSATTTATTTLINFSRTVTFGDVYRHTSTHDIEPATSTNPKYLDPDTRSATVVVTWASAASTTETLTLTTYFANFMQ